jgi:hypothetical protein
VVVPDDPDKLLLQHSNTSMVFATFRYCFDEHGVVVNVERIAPSGLPSYDRKISAAIAKWVLVPHLVDGHPTKACTAAAFIYSQR